MEKVKAFFKETGNLFKTNTGNMIFVIAVAFILSALIFGGGNDAAKQPDSASVDKIAEESVSEPEQINAEPQQEQTDKTKGDLGDYYVEILDGKKTTDYDGKSAYLVSFLFQNNSEERAAFEFSISPMAFQNGQQLEYGICDEIDYAGEVMPGYSNTSTYCFVLQDDSPVTVICKELISFDKTELEKTFTIE